MSAITFSTPTPATEQASSLLRAGAVRFAFAVLLAITVGLALLTASAHASTGYASAFSFSESFSGPVGLAVDNSADASKGDVYVVDQGNNAIKKFAISGETATELWSVELPGAQPNQATVDAYSGADEGDVFIAAFAKGAIDQVNAAGTTTTEVLTGVSEPTGVAVDAAGDFFVSTNGGSVLEYNAKWEPVEAAGLMSPSNTVISGLSGLQTVAVAASGEAVYAATENGALTFTLLAGEYTGPTTLDSAAATGVTLGPEGNVFVDQGNEVSFYEPSGTRLGGFGAHVLGAAYGIGATAADVFVADNERNHVHVFEAGIAPEAPETKPTTDVLGTSATLNGTVNLAAGQTSVEYFFEYAPGASCEGGTKTPVKQGSGEVSEPVTGLSLLTGYTACLRTQNRYGEAIGNQVGFETPSVGDEDSPNVSATEATVTALIQTSEETTSYQVEYGTGSVTEHATPEPAATTPGSSITTRLQHVLTSLTPSTTYEFRFTTTNGHGTVTGETRTFTTPATTTASTETCPNAKLRSEQPYGQTLPDCRAYEMVSPADTEGQDAADQEVSGRSRAAVSGDAITYESTGAFSDPEGTSLISQFLSRRETNGWTTQAITPRQENSVANVKGSYETAVFSPELSSGVAGTSANLAGEEAAELHGESYNLYQDDFTGSSPYRYVGKTGLWPFPWGASSDLSRIVYGEGGGIGAGSAQDEGVSEWADGTVVPVGVTNEEESMPVSVGAEPPGNAFSNFKDAWRAVSSNGTRVYFSSPATERAGFGDLEPLGQLFVRVNVGALQSPLAGPEANGTGDLTEGSDVVRGLVAASGLGTVSDGSDEVTLERVWGGRFVVGDPVTSAGISGGTPITAIHGTRLTLSAPYTGTSEAHRLISSEGPLPFVVGEPVSGDGISPGTTITAEKAGELTLSAPVVSSGAGVELRGGGECFVVGDACTVDVSASQRLAANPAGRQLARFWGASADGSRVFFTSKAELTEDASTGSDGQAANLYEYDLERPAGERLKDLTVEHTGNGAGVLGVVQISEDGSYVYFVAEGVLATGAVAGHPNLYVVHDDGAPRLVATLAAGDETDWHGATSPEYQEAGPAKNTAVVGPSGSGLAFVSERSLTGYDNEQAAPGECEAHIDIGVEFTESGACREVFWFDPDAGAGKELVCVSCDGSGARPVGPSGFGGLPRQSSSYRPRNVSEGGVVFFDSSDALAGAPGGVQQVFEYENGQVHAISHASGRQESFFLDASVTGDDVFFGTADRLLPQASGGNVVVYDARVDGGFPAAAEPVACEAEGSCRAPQSLPAAGSSAPASSVYSGPGNLTPTPAPKPKPKPLTRAQKLAAALRACRRADAKHRTRRLLCEVSARRRYGPVKKAKRASNDRRTHR